MYSDFVRSLVKSGSAEQKLFLAPLTLPLGFSWSMSFCQHVWVFAGTTLTTFGAISKGAALTDRCLDGLCDSLRRAGRPVHEVTPAALSAETLGMRIIPSHGVCGHTDKRIFRHCVFDAPSSCLRKGRATHYWSSLIWSYRLARSGVPFDSVYKFAAKHWMSRGNPRDTLKFELRAYAGLLSLCCTEVCCSDASNKGWSFASRTALVSLVERHHRVLERFCFGTS